MPRFWASLAIMFSTPLIYSASAYADSVVGQADEVIQWNKVLLTIVRTPGAQPSTVHPTRSYAIMHAAIYDAVNAIDKTHAAYAVRQSDVPRNASQDAAAATAAHDVLAALYPKFQATLDAQLQQSLAAIQDGTRKQEGIAVGTEVARR